MPKGKEEVSLSYDIDLCLDRALRSDSQNRLLWFARIRDNIIQTSPNEIGETIKPIIQRFRKVGSDNPQLAHWLLNILQMCVLHCTDKFVEELNRQDVLQPFCETLTLRKYIERYNEVVRLKLFTLLKSWHELYKDIWPNCAFTKAYETVLFGGEPSPLKPTNFHWLPNRNIVDENVDSSLYDLDKVAKELLERNNKSLSKLRALSEEAERSGVKNTRKIPGNLQNTAYEAAWRIDADLRFWEDIVKNADIPTESIQDIFTMGEKFRETKEAIRQIAERLKVAGTLSSGRFGEDHEETQVRQDLRAGEARSLERGYYQPVAGNLSSGRFGEDHAETQVRQGLRAGEARSLERGFDQPAAGNLPSDRVGDSHAVTRDPQGETRSWERGYDQSAAGNLSSGRFGEDHALTQVPQGLRTGGVCASECGFDQPAAGNLPSDRVGESHAVTRDPQGEARSLEHGFNQPSAGSLSSGRVGEGHAGTQGPQGDVCRLERGFDRPTPKSRSSLPGKADNTLREDASVAGFKDRPAGTFDADVEGDYEIIPKSRSSLAGTVENTFHANVEGDYEIITNRLPSRRFDDNGSQMNASTANHSVLPQNPAGPHQEPVQTDMSRSEVPSSSGDRIKNTLEPGVNPQTARTYANWTCPICQIGFQAKQELLDHRSSELHKQKVAALPPLPADEQESNDGFLNRVTSWFRG